MGYQLVCSGCGRTWNVVDPADVSAAVAGADGLKSDLTNVKKTIETAGTSCDENALSYTISLALYAARNFYTVYRELPTGKGFADLVFVPRKQFPDKPALIVELKWDKSASGAISQIKEKSYVQSLKEYHGNLLLVGINYDVKTKEHECIIEQFTK